MKAGQLRVWWTPQVPCEQFHVDVNSIEQGVKVMAILAEYDAFQFSHNIKPDYCNAGGIEVYSDDCDGEGNAGWESWYCHETGEDDPVEWLAQRGIEVHVINPE